MIINMKVTVGRGEGKGDDWGGSVLGASCPQRAHLPGHQQVTCLGGSVLSPVQDRFGSEIASCHEVILRKR